MNGAGGFLAGAAAVALAAAGPAYLSRLDAPGPQPEGIASDGIHLWVADFQSGRLYRMDTASGTVVKSYPAPGPHPEGLTWDGTHLWCADWENRKIYRLAVSDSVLTVEATLDPPSIDGATPRPVGLAWDGAALWLTTWEPYWLFRIDPSSGYPVRGRDLRAPDSLYPVQYPRPEDLAWDGDQLWITDWGTRFIYRIHPDSLTVTRTVPSGGPASVGLTFHGGRLWNGDTGDAGILPALYELEVTPGSTPAARATWGRLKARWSGP